MKVFNISVTVCISGLEHLERVLTMLEQIKEKHPNVNINIEVRC